MATIAETLAGWNTSLQGIVASGNNLYNTVQAAQEIGAPAPQQVQVIPPRTDITVGGYSFDWRLPALVVGGLLVVVVLKLVFRGGK